jgi:hypothetical protein
MKIACIDIAAEVLASLLPVLTTAGLAIGGSLDRGEPAEITASSVVRLVVLDEAGSVLPDDCEQGIDRPGLPIVTATIREERRDGFRVIRLESVEIAGYLTRERRIIYPDRPVDPNITKALAEARSCPT